MSCFRTMNFAWLFCVALSVLSARPLASGVEKYLFELRDAHGKRLGLSLGLVALAAAVDIAFQANKGQVLDCSSVARIKTSVRALVAGKHWINLARSWWRAVKFGKKLDDSESLRVFAGKHRLLTAAFSVAVINGIASCIQLACRARELNTSDPVVAGLHDSVDIVSGVESLSDREDEDNDGSELNLFDQEVLNPYEAAPFYGISLSPAPSCCSILLSDVDSPSSANESGDEAEPHAPGWWIAAYADVILQEQFSPPVEHSSYFLEDQRTFVSEIDLSPPVLPKKRFKAKVGAFFKKVFHIKEKKKP